MCGRNLKQAIPAGFDSPIALPTNPDQERQWQEANRDWWENHPMRATMMSWKKIPFDSLINFESLQEKDVLEVGCGNGSHAQLVAAHARSYVGIDLTLKKSNMSCGQMATPGLWSTTAISGPITFFPD